MHGGRAGDPVVGAGKGVKTIGCDREHEEHEALVEHFQVHTFVISLNCCERIMIEFLVSFTPRRVLS